jgi:hypothetical protein
LREEKCRCEREEKPRRGAHIWVIISHGLCGPIRVTMTHPEDGHP